MKIKCYLYLIPSLLLLFFLIGCGSSSSSDPSPTPVIDETAPTIGNGGLIIATPTRTTIVASWTKASDGTTAEGNLEYKVYYSLNQSTVSALDTITSATAQGDFQKAMTTITIVGLTEATTYYLNVVVKDEAGNQALYSVKEARTLDESAPVISNHNITVSGAPSSSLILTWTAATDDSTLDYEVYWSQDASLDTVANIGTYGGTANQTVSGTTATVSSLPSEILYFNILAKDAEANLAAYAMVQVDNRGNLSGTVVDGYIRNALVCIDLNGNDECDDGEPYQKTDASGDYSNLKISQSTLDGIAVPVVILQGGVDISTGQLFTSMLKAPIIDGNTQVNLTPLTGLVAQRLISQANAQGGSFDLNAEFAAAKTAIGDTLDVSADALMSDPVEAAKTGGANGKQLLEKAILIQKIVEIVSAAEKETDASDDTQDEQNKRAKAGNVLSAIADQMTGTSKSMTTIVGGLSDATADIPKAGTLESSLLTVVSKIEGAFGTKGDNISAEEVNQLCTAAQTVAEVVEEQIDQDWDASADTFSGSFRANDVSTDLGQVDVLADDFYERLDFDRLLSMIGLDQNATFSDATYDHLLSVFSGGIDGNTTLPEFYTLVNTNAGDATLDAVSGTILGAINTFFVQYADLLQADVTADLVTVDASGDAYFTFVSPLSNRFVFSLTNISGDPEDLEIMIYSNNTLSAEIPTSTNRGISSLTMSPLYEIEGEYWIKIKNNSGSSMTFNFSAAVETTDRGLLDELSLYDDFSGVSLNPSLWREISESSFHISGGELVIDLSLPAGHSGEHHSSTMKAKTSDRMGIAADFKILEQGGAIQSAYNGFRYVWFYNDTSGDAIGVFLEQHGGIGGSVFYSIMRCPAPQDDCESDNLELVTNGSLGGSIQKDQTFRLSILWDGNTTFTLSVDSTTDVIDVSADAPFGNANVINNDFVELGPEIKTFDGGGFLKSAIDNVSIHNGSTWEEFDLFTDPVIDSTKWGELGTRAIENGAFRSGVVSGGWGGLSTNPEANLSTIAVDVTVKSQTGYGEAAIVYPAYHDGNGIIMGILSLSDTEATAIVWRCNNPCDNDDSNGPILKKEVLGSVVVGSSHTLALQWDGTVFRFQLDNNESFSISPTALGAPVVTVVSFGVTIQPLTVDYSGTQIDLGQSLSGSIDVVFDNVRAKRATASSFERIEGAWDGGENVGSALSDHSVLVFFPNGIYFQWEDAFDSPDPKAEIGSYTYNNGILNVTGHIQNGRGGFDVTDDSGPWTDPITAPISSDILAFSDWGIQFSKVKNTNNPMVGAWSNRSTPTGRWALEEFTPHFGYGYFMMFYSDGTYFVWADTAYGCAAGEEIGTYSFADGILTIESIIIDNTCKGFNEPKTIPIEFKSYGLELGGYGFNRVK